MHGVLVVDKPEGCTSFDVVARARRALRLSRKGAIRIGHAGTLDPMATGVLLVCVGEATKLVPYLMDADKEYRATARLGVTTDTDDAAPGSRVIGRASAAALAALTEDAVVSALTSQVGLIRQRPPLFSALKSDGERLYDLARKAREDADPDGEAEARAQATAQAKERVIRVDDITVESIRLAAGGEDSLPEVTFRVRCGKGTYIRAIARDLGERLGVGAHLSSLRRLRVGRFGVEQGVTLDQLMAGRTELLDLALAAGHLVAFHASDESSRRLQMGQRAELAALAEQLDALAVASVSAPSGVATAPVAAPVAVFNSAGALIAVLERGPEDGVAAWRIGRGFNAPQAPQAPQASAQASTSGAAAPPTAGGPTSTGAHNGTLETDNGR